MSPLEVHDPGLHDLIASDAAIERIAGGLTFTEGPVWRVTRVADDGARTVLAEHFQGKRLNSPNDIVVKSDGSIYFTDPPYAVQPSRPGVVRPPGWWTQPIPGKEQPCHGVYRLAPDGI